MEQPAVRKIIRSRKERVFAGICGGLAVYLGLDPVLVRVLFVALTMLSNGVGIIVYLLGWFIIPLEAEGAPAYIPPVESPGSNRTLKIVGIFLLVAGFLAIFTSFLPSIFDLDRAQWLGPIILILIGVVFILWQKNATSAEMSQSQPDSTQNQTGGPTMSASSSTQSTPNFRRLMRSQSDRKIAGVCGGVGDYFNIDPTIIRLIWLALIFVVGTGLLLYIICWIAMPLSTKHPLATSAPSSQTPAQTPTASTAPPLPDDTGPTTTT